VGEVSVGARARDLVLQALGSGQITPGPLTRRFEETVARLHGRRHGLFLASGGAALLVALAALKEARGWRDEDEVLVPALTFAATANAVLLAGLTPVFVDVEPRYYTMDPAVAAARIGPRTRALLPVHLAGLPADMEPLVALARARGLALVEDSCQAMFVRYRGRPVGSFGEVACLSTAAGHLLSTGAGGLGLTDDADLLALMRSLAHHGRDPVYTRVEDGAHLDGAERWALVERRFAFPRVGWSLRSTELEAALGLGEIEDREALLARRRQIAEGLTRGLAGLEGRLGLPRPRPGAGHAWMVYPMVLEGSESRAGLARHLEERGIETRPLFPLLTQPPWVKRYGDLTGDNPVAARLGESGLYVGCHPGLDDDDVAYLVRSVLDWPGWAAAAGAAS
jgi:perosamine synthetase